MDSGPNLVPEGFVLVYGTLSCLFWNDLAETCRVLTNNFVPTAGPNSSSSFVFVGGLIAWSLNRQQRDPSFGRNQAMRLSSIGAVTNSLQPLNSETSGGTCSFRDSASFPLALDQIGVG